MLSRRSFVIDDFVEIKDFQQVIASNRRRQQCVYTDEEYFKRYLNVVLLYVLRIRETRTKRVR